MTKEDGYLATDFRHDRRNQKKVNKGIKPSRKLACPRFTVAIRYIFWYTKIK